MGACLNENPGGRGQRKIKFGDYKLTKQEIIANGAYGDIWKCKSHSGQIFALKQIKLQTKQLKEMFKKEVRVLKKLLKVESVVHIVDSVIIKNEANLYETGYILMQFCPFTLFDELKRNTLSEGKIAQILYSILGSLKQIHGKGIIHMDLKPQNILLHNNQYKICDFGSCLEKQINIRQLSKKQKSQLNQYIQSNSTLIYRSPELINLKPKINSKTDIWMLGCIGYLLLYRKHPFESNAKLGIVTGTVQYETQSQLNECIKGMLCVSVDDRWDQFQVDQALSKIIFNHQHQHQHE